VTSYRNWIELTAMQRDIRLDYNGFSVDCHFEREAMPLIQTFQESEAWKKARKLTCLVYDASSKGKFASDFGLRDQIRRGSVSIMSNIAEGFERGGKREFKRFLTYSLGSAGEVKSLLYVALDVGYLSDDGFKALFNLASEISRIVVRFRQSLTSES
jgi:four helix bundle protein